MKRKGSLGSSASSLSLAACSSAIVPPLGVKSKTYVEFHASMSLDNPASAMDYLVNAVSVEGASSGQQHEQVVSATSFEHTTLEEVLKQRFHVWSRVQDVRNAAVISVCVIEELTPFESYACDVAALKKLQELHHLCNILPYIQMHLCIHECPIVSWCQSLILEISDGPQQRETHLRTLQLALLHERNLRASKKGVSGPVSLPSAAQAAPSDTVPSSSEIKRPAMTATRADSDPDPAALVEQLVESLETFDRDDVIDLFQLAM